MAVNLKRRVERDFLNDPTTEGFNKRDYSMYLNFQWLRERLPSRSKIIFWGANIHVAKDLSVISGYETKRSFGSYVHDSLKNRAAFMGFSAFSGSYAMIDQDVQNLSVAPLDSLEGKAFLRNRTNIRYLATKQIDDLGTISARPLGYGFRTAVWKDVFDGLLVVREERPPHFLKP